MLSFHLWYFIILITVTGIMRNCCKYDYKEVAAMLIECGADVDSANNAGSTPLYTAARVSD